MVPAGRFGESMPQNSGSEQQGPGAKAAGPPAIVCGSSFGSVSATVTGGILWVAVENEPSGDDIVSCLRQARDTRLFGTCADTLVDLTRFTGVVDWEALHQVREMAPWGLGWSRPPRVAYVSRDRLFGAVIRAVGGVFTSARHRLFRDQAAALAWLRTAAE